MIRTNDEKIKSGWGGARASIEGARASIEGAEEAQKEHRRSRGSIEGASREHMAETGLSARAKRRRLIQQTVTCLPEFGETIYIYIYIANDKEDQEIESAPSIYASLDQDQKIHRYFRVMSSLYRDQDVMSGGGHNRKGRLLLPRWATCTRELCTHRALATCISGDIMSFI